MYPTGSSATTAIVIVAAIVAAVHHKLSLLPYELRMVEFLEKTEQGTKRKNMAASVIAKAWEVRKAVKGAAIAPFCRLRCRSVLKNYARSLAPSFS